MTISEEFSDRQNSLSINLMKKWESKFLSFSSSSADITAMAIIATTQVKVARMGTIEVMALIEPDTVVKLSKEIPIIAIGTVCNGIDIPHIPGDKITDNGGGRCRVFRLLPLLPSKNSIAVILRRLYRLSRLGEVHDF